MPYLVRIAGVNMHCTLRHDRVVLRDHGYIFPCLCHQECFLFVRDYGLHRFVCLVWIPRTWHWHLKSAGFVWPEGRWFMKMFRNKKSFFSKAVHFECSYKLISACSKAAFKAGLADGEIASTAADPAGTFLSAERPGCLKHLCNAALSPATPGHVWGSHG